MSNESTEHTEGREMVEPTPGPWKMDESASNVLDIWADDGTRGGVTVAQVWDPEDQITVTDQMRADAVLISRVHDFLKALREIAGDTGRGEPADPKDRALHYRRTARLALNSYAKARNAHREPTDD